MTTVLASDLDRTLIYSRAAIQVALPAGEEPELVCVEMLDGRPQSFMTAAAADGLRRVRPDFVLVPMTTRTLAQFDRVRLPGGPVEYAVTSNGGNIVVRGVPDAEWARLVRERIADQGAPLREITLGLAERAAGGWVLNRRVADELFCYLVVDLVSIPPDFLNTWRQWCSERGWVVSMQGRKIYALPRGLTKSAALAEIMSRLGATRLLAAGDGVLDADVLSMADAAIRPPHGELADLDWREAHLTIAEASGVLAGEEIVRWFAEQSTSVQFVGSARRGPG